jgi:hypothetical protein
MQYRIALALFTATLGWCAAPAEVRLWETNLAIPTYVAAPPSGIPRFYEGRTYQGAKATFYPIQDVLTEIKTNKSYQVLLLENDYVPISVIPELGGRIWSALNKVNGYDFFYRQHVVKPPLIGMPGAWISGGVEWNVPQPGCPPAAFAVSTRATPGPWLEDSERNHPKLI